MTIANEVVEVEASCWECGYALRGLPSRRCPECGRPFDPADPTTLNTGHVVGPLTRRLMSPPGWPIYLLLPAAVLVSLWACVVPTRRGEFSDALSELLLMSPAMWWRRYRGDWWAFDWPFGRFLLAAALWTLLLVVWILRRIARGLTVRRVSRQRAATFAYWRRWLVVPVVFGVTVLICITRLPTYAGFWISRPWLDRAVAEAKVNRYVWQRPIGAFPPCPPYSTGKTAQVVRGTDGQTIVHISFYKELVYREDGQQPVLPGSPTVTRLSARWFLTEID